MQGVVSTLYRSRDLFGLQLTSIVHFYKRMQVNKMMQMKFSPSLPKLYNMILSNQKSFSRIWKPAPRLEEFEARVEHSHRFPGQLDRKGLGFVPGRYGSFLSIVERKQRIQDCFKAFLHDSFIVHDMDLCKVATYVLMT